MSNKIHVLNEIVINRIAAGEVVERPVSVVKELIENAIDAMATAIQLDIEDGGRKLIRVKDNGIGMSHDDAFLALERHATSKLQSEKDLIEVQTMGFRGEALASISSVSRMRFMTKDESDEVGTRVVSEGGRITNAEPVAMNQGTIVEVRNIFYNAPVRRKYLKSAALESGFIHDLVLKIAIANPLIAFTFCDDGKIKVQTTPAPSLKERVSSLFPSEIVGNLVELDCSLDRVSLSGFIARPPYTRSSMRYIFTFVNGRPVKDRLINSSIIKAFANLVERGRYPIAIVCIRTPPDEVDVNVHPQKAEVRFLRPGVISGLITKAINEAIIGKDSNHPVHFNDWTTPTKFNVSLPDYASDGESQRKSFQVLQENNGQGFSFPQLGLTSQSNLGSRPKLTELSFLGRLPNSFVVLHDEQGLVILDHHAAHERLVFNRLCSSSESDPHIESQDLLDPMVVELTALESETLREHAEILSSAGFVLEEFGQNSFLVRSVPLWIEAKNLDNLLKDFVDTALQTGIKADPESLRRDLFRNLACRAAIKGSANISSTEISNLLLDLETTDGPSDVCPHGRPILVRISFDELRRRLGRK